MRPVFLSVSAACLIGACHGSLMDYHAARTDFLREVGMKFVMQELQENDVSGPGDWQDPAIIIASAVDNLESSDEQDHLHFAEEVIETHNSSEWAREMGGIGVEVEDVMEALRSSDKHWASY